MSIKNCHHVATAITLIVAIATLNGWPDGWGWWWILVWLGMINATLLLSRLLMLLFFAQVSDED